jgi:type IV pilus assembly protein PilQ
VSKHKQIITSVVMGSVVAAISVTTVSAATQTTVHSKQNLGKNLIAQTRPPANQQPLVPNPKITIDGIAPTPGVGIATPTMPRAVAPPVGDISVSNIDAGIPQIKLDSESRTNLTLKGAPAREVLESLARAANLNLAYADSPVGGDGKGKVDATVSVNFRNEPVQNAFNYVLQLSGLEANRVGNTIFVGARLPDSIRETIVRTLRMNQVTSAAAANFLATQGAEAQIPVTTVTVTNTGSDIAQSSAGGSGPAGSALSKVTETRSATIQSIKATTENGPLVLKGLSVSTDERLNSITLVGSPRKVAMATQMLTRLDARRRQVALNVKIVDVNLSHGDSFGSNLNFSSGTSTFGSTGGSAVLNFGGDIAANAAKLITSITAKINSGNAKILTDPTLVVQESQRSTVNLTSEVFGGFETSVAPTGNSTNSATIINQKPIIKNAGLIVDLLVNRIDDNGYVSVSVSPTVSAPGTATGPGGIGLLQSRTLNSGEVRLRDGQTLILSGIIQESDRADVSKVPILGDIPLLGALFRSTTKSHQRQEVVVLLTPQILNDDKSQVNYTPGADSRSLIGK